MATWFEVRLISKNTVDDIAKPWTLRRADDSIRKEKPQAVASFIECLFGRVLFMLYLS